LEGANVTQVDTSECGKAELSISAKDDLFEDMSKSSTVWISHVDIISNLPKNLQSIASIDNDNVAAYRVEGEPTWGVQFNPEVVDTEEGVKLFSNFLDICECKRDWTPASFVESTVNKLKQELGDDKIILALSGGVDSSVAAVLLHRAIGENLTCVFVDHGLLRKNEFEDVLRDYEHLGLNVIGVNAKERFFKELKGVVDPEEKRKIIGKGFIDVFDEEANKLKDIKWLAQGTIYPDIIESISVTGVVIKSHHNVGGLPEKMNLKLCEPLKLLFKDEVRKIGLELGMKPHLIDRHPFPGPGLGIRILGDITPEKVRITQEADHIYISNLRSAGLYNEVWQAGAILLPVQSVGVTNDERTYESTIALRAVTSVDALTADWSRLPHEFLAKVSNQIINNVKGVNRVVFDISSKPPATIEWE
ncbi:MAG: glutamine-hydrolyzing GMP synthase, partial [Bacteroidales bacterium]|nr:glutamine-hydrolyzing GMP synthase [Bacteroidales bacterium]